MKNVGIRWLIRRDMGEVLQIERTSFEFPWTEDEFLCCLRQRNCIGVVAEIGCQQIIGFMLYELQCRTLRILKIAVDAEYRRRGVGSRMVEPLVDKLSHERRSEIEVGVRETNLPAQLFFAEFGFRAVAVQRSHYDDTGEDAYHMLYSLGVQPELEKPVNRLSEYWSAT